MMKDLNKRTYLNTYIRTFLGTYFFVPIFLTFLKRSFGIFSQYLVVAIAYALLHICAKEHTDEMI